MWTDHLPEHMPEMREKEETSAYGEYREDGANQRRYKEELVLMSALHDELVQLQTIGLMVNEYSKDHTTVPVETYKQLLDYSISLVREAGELIELIEEA